MNVIEHTPNLVHLTFVKDPNVAEYEVRAARTLNDAYIGEPAVSPLNGVAGTGTSRLFSVRSGDHYRSTGLKRKRLGMIEESSRNLTLAKYDPDEYTGGGSQAPADRDFAFLRVREFRRALGAYATEGPIYIVPPPNFYTMPHPVLNIGGTAPLIGGTANGVPPLPGSMVIELPKYMGDFRITNLSSTNPLFVSFGHQMPMREIPSGADTHLGGANQEILILASTGAAVNFALFGAVMNAAI